MDFPWEISNGTQLGDLEGFWSEIVMVRCSGDLTEFRLSGHKRMPFTKTDRYGVRNCAYRGLGGLGGQRDAQRCQNQGF